MDNVLKTLDYWERKEIYRAQLDAIESCFLLQYGSQKMLKEAKGKKPVEKQGPLSILLAKANPFTSIQSRLKDIAPVIFFFLSYFMSFSFLLDFTHQHTNSLRSLPSWKQTKNTNKIF